MLSFHNLLYFLAGTWSIFIATNVIRYRRSCRGFASYPSVPECISLWMVLMVRSPLRFYDGLVCRPALRLNDWWLKRHPLLKPQVVKIEKNGIAVVASREDYERCKKWHLGAVRDGLKLASEPLIVKPCFLFLHISVRITSENEEVILFTGFFSDMDRLLEGCLVEEVTDMYVPFLSKNSKKKREEAQNFKYASKAEARHYLFGITDSGFRRVA